MRIAVIGAGGVGGYFGGRLAQAGIDVTFIARGATLDALRDHGLRVESILGDFAIDSVQTTDDARAVGTVDAILMAVKAWQLAEAAEQVRPMIGPDTMLVPLENGIDAPEVLSEVVGREHVVGGLCAIVSFVVAPGHIRHAAAEPTILFGELDHRRSERIEQLHAAFELAGVRVEVPPDIRRSMWTKFLFIAPMSGIGAMTRMPIGVWRAQPEIRALTDRLLREVAALATVRGIDLGADAVERTWHRYDSLPPESTSSMQRDIMDGKPSELDAQLGAIVRLARESGVETPATSVIYDALLPLEQRARGCTTMPAVTQAAIDTTNETEGHPALVEARRVLEVEAAAILGVIDHLDQAFVNAVELVATSTGRVVTMGVGKSGIICKKISATLASTGTPSFFMHPTEALHGDLGMLVRGDVVLSISNSGETEELVRLLPSIKRVGAEIIAITGNPTSTLARGADHHLSAAISREACPLGLAPTASTTATLALGDALAMALLVRRGFREEDFGFLHPGGKLGKRFLRVHELMHHGDDVPLVREHAGMRDVIYEMSKKGFGITAVTDGAGAMLGVISDGDLRRLLEHDEEVMRKSAAESMKRDPITIAGSELASAALQIMEERKITSLFIVDERRRVEGIIHLHDLWGLELF